MKQKTMIMAMSVVTIAMSFEAFAAAGATGTRSRKIVNDSTSYTRSYRIAKNDTPTPATTVTAPTTAVTPRKVQTLKINPDGSIAKNADGTPVKVTAPATAPTGPSSVFAAPTSLEGISAFKKIEEGNKKAEDMCRDKKGYEADTTYINMPDPKNPGFTVQVPQVACKPSSMMAKYPELYAACNNNPFDENERKNNSGCKAAWDSSDLNTCGKKTKEANEAFNKFTQACADAGMAGVKTCMDEAKACVTASEDEDTSADNEFNNDFWKSIGVANDSKKSFSDKSSRVKKCSVYGLKDYETEKRERTRTLRDAQKEMAELQKDLAKDKKELAEKKKEIQEDFVKMQAEMRKDMTEQQKAQAEEGMDAQKQMMEVDMQKAELRAANITARSQAAKITGERALALAELSDAMIHTRCMAELEKVISEMKVGMSSSTQNYMNNFAERKRRVMSVKELCYAKLEATRAATAKDYRAQIDAVDNMVEENNRRIQALEDQKVSIGNNQKEAITRAATAQQSANNELYQKMQASQAQLQELLASSQQQEMAANQNITQAQQRMNETLSDIGDLGSRPKGLKQPTEAASQFRTFKNIVKAMDSDGACTTEVKKLTDMVNDSSLKEYYDNDLGSDSDSDSGRD